MLCHRQQLSAVFEGIASWAEPGFPPDFAGSFVFWEVSSPQQSGHIRVAASADPAQVCHFLGIAEALPALQLQSAVDVSGQVVQVGLPSLSAFGSVAGQVASAGLGLVLTCRGPFVVDFHGPLV